MGQRWAGAAIQAALMMITPDAAIAQSQALRTYNIPEQDLATALRVFAAASGREVVASSDLLAGKRSGAAVGPLSPEQAVDHILAGTGLSYRIVEGAFIIRATTLAGAEEAPSSDQPQIVVTGSRIRGAPIASPVITIGQEEIRNAGASSLGEVVRTIPQSFGGGQNPGVGTNVPGASGANVGSGSSINLRGIGSDATLTLVNGHRLSYSASRQSIDVSAIPLGIVDRIEIVPDGASALYGSDAVAGVANIIFKRDFDGLQTSARIGAATDGGDFEQRYGLTGGQRWSSGGLIASYEFARITPIYGRDRSYAEKRSPALTLLPSLKRHSAALSGHQALSSNLTIELDALYNKRWSEISYANNAAGDISISGMRTAFEAESFVIAPTIRLALDNGWQVHATGSYGRDRTHFVVTTITAGATSKSPRICYCNSAENAEIGADGNLFDAPGGSVKLAFGGGYRANHFSRFNGPGNPQNISPTQDSYYLYGELSVPLVSPTQSISLVDRLELSAALRYENYPGIDEIATPKLGLIYAPTPDFSLQASWGRSFRAPTLLQEYQARSIVLLPPQFLGGSTGYPPGTAALFVQGGNPELKPERARTWSATIDVHPRALPGASLELSYFDIDYRDRVVTPVAFASQALSNPIYAGRLTANPSASLLAQIVASATDFSNLTGAPYDPAQVSVLIDDTNVNAGRQSIHGVDALLSYRAEFGQSGQTLRATLNASYLDSEQQISASQPVLPLAGVIFNPPHLRSRGGLTWEGGPWTVSGYVNYIGSVRDTRSSPASRLDAMTTVDVALRFRPTSSAWPTGFDFSLSVSDLFNDKPEPFATTFFSDTPYDSTNYSPVGRFIVVTVRKAW